MSNVELKRMVHVKNVLDPKFLGEGFECKPTLNVKSHMGLVFITFVLEYLGY